jgi:hypothetical protein
MVLYKKGIEKIDQEMDIRLLSKNMRTLKFVQEVIFSKSQRFLIPYFKERVLTQKEVTSQNNTEEHLEKYLKKTVDNIENTMDKRILKNIEIESGDEATLTK